MYTWFNKAEKNKENRGGILDTQKISLGIENQRFKDDYLVHHDIKNIIEEWEKVK